MTNIHSYSEHLPCIGCEAALLIIGLLGVESGLFTQTDCILISNSIYISPVSQVMNRLSGEYEDSGFVEGGIFVNIGDMLQMWSADILLANVSSFMSTSTLFLYLYTLTQF